MTTASQVLLLSAACLAMAACSQQKSLEGASSKVRIGVYDSRSIAVAFSGSDLFNEHISGLGEAEMKAEQKLRHKQGFSTAPVDDILDLVKDQLPGVQEEADVQAIVSKWDKDGLAEYESAEQVDITMSLAALFNPNEKQLRSAEEIQKHKPISLDKLEKHLKKH